MNIFSDITKSTLENLIKNSFLKFGNIKACNLIDSIKSLGFFYATVGGISISIEDLKTSSATENILTYVKSQSALKTLEWKEGKISDIERYETILNNWNIATEYIKIEILSFYKKFDPLNCLYLMSNSGARGNMSQVRQLIGLRGLMLDQEGKVIDTPIDTSFAKGLTTIDYIISAYGARKGIVDTAIKTADAGYLTRRLIFLAQNIAIRNIDCNTSYSNTIMFTNKTNESTFVGRYLINIKDQLYNKVTSFETFENSLITKELINLLKSYNSNFYLTIRTVFNCNNRDSICQKCYGYDLAYYENVQLGEMVGIVAAQSIGEPGTQLTMRTFHTGGVFTSKIVTKSAISLSAKIFIPEGLMGDQFKIKDQILSILNRSRPILFMEWFGKNLKIKFNKNYYLPFNTSKICYKGDYFGEHSLPKFSPRPTKLKPFILNEDVNIYGMSIGSRSTNSHPKIVDNKLVPKKIVPLRSQSLLVVYKPSFLILKIGKILTINENFQKFLKSTITKLKASAKIKISSLNSGLINIIKNILILITPNARYFLNIKELIKQHSFTNQITQLYIPLQKFQFFDAYSKILEIFLIPNFSEKLYYIKKPINGYKKMLFTSGNYKSWNTYFDISKIFLNKDQYIENEKSYNQLIYFTNNAIFFKKNGSHLYFQDYIKYFFPVCTIINSFTERNLASNYILGKSFALTMQGNDIVQGLPKVEEIVDAVHVKPKYQACLAKHGGFVIRNGIVRIATPEKEEEFNEFRQKTMCTFYFDTRKKNLKVNSIFSYESLEKISFKKSIYVVPSKSLKSNLLHFKGFSTSATIQGEYNKKLEPNEYCNGIWEYKKNNYYVLKRLNKLVREKKKNEKSELLKEIIKELDNKIFMKKFQQKPYKRLQLRRKSFAQELSEECVLNFEKLPEFIENCHVYRPTLLLIKNQILTINLNIYISGKTRFFIQHPNFPNKIGIYPNCIKEQKSLFKSLYFKSKSLTSQQEHAFFVCKPLSDNNLHKTLNEKTVGYGDYVHLGEPISYGRLDPHKLLSILYNYYNDHYNNQNIALYKSINKLRLIIVSSLISVYEPQGVKIALKHIEIISKQLTSKASLSKNSNINFTIIKNPFNIFINPILPNEDIELSLAMSLYTQYKILEKYQSGLNIPHFIPIFKSSINTAITRKSFLSSASFQHTKSVLIKASLLGATDWTIGLKERIILGKLIPGGTTYRQLYSNNINKISFYKTI